jgi:nucleoside-diphosphate-sugar epimerase
MKTKDIIPSQKGVVMDTYAEISELRSEIGFKPKVTLEGEIKIWAAWYNESIAKYD